MKREKFLSKESGIWPHWIESKKDTLDREAGVEGTLGTEPGSGDGDEEHKAAQGGVQEGVPFVSRHAASQCL